MSRLDWWIAPARPWYIERPFPWPLSVAIVVLIVLGALVLGAALA